MILEGYLLKIAGISCMSYPYVDFHFCHKHYSTWFDANLYFDMAFRIGNLSIDELNFLNRLSESDLEHLHFKIRFQEDESNEKIIHATLLSGGIVFYYFTGKRPKNSRSISSLLEDLEKAY